MRTHSNKIAVLMAGGLLMAASLAVQAAPIACINGGVNDTYSASANGSYADACHYYSASNIANPTAITNLTNSIWGGTDPFTYVGKNGEAGDIAGFDLQVSGSDSEFQHLYQLVVPAAWAGSTVDWVLGIKQSNNSYMSYLFEDVTLGINGGFNNFWLNASGKEVNDFSFAAGFIRLVEVPVPDPGTLGLLGLGLVGLGFARRKTAAS